MNISYRFAKLFALWCGGRDVTKAGISNEAPKFTYVTEEKLMEYKTEQENKQQLLEKRVLHDFKEQIKDEIRGELFTLLFQSVSNVMGNAQTQESEASMPVKNATGVANIEEEEPLPNDQIMNLIAGWADGN